MLQRKQIDGNWDKLSNPKNAYLYNGKELHDWNGLNWQDFNFRYYMPEIGRFTGVDPIADEYPHVSVYNYAENDPIRHIDLWGLQKALPSATSNPLMYMAEGFRQYMQAGLSNIDRLFASNTNKASTTIKESSINAKVGKGVLRTSVDAETTTTFKTNFKVF